MKKRIDKLLVERGLADTQERAQALVMAGNVLVDNQPAVKAGMVVPDNAEVRLKQAPYPYVSRAGVKLEGAIRFFEIEVTGKVCLDIGSSTGGFTHFLLINGAQRIFALDVDIQQLDWSVRNDPRVRTIEMNARFLEPAHLGEAVDLVTIDASFISLTLLLPRIPAVMKSGAACMALVKPQFEVEREQVGKGGIVRDPKLHQQAIDKVTRTARDLQLEFHGSYESPITGRQGNHEFFLFLRKS